MSTGSRDTQGYGAFEMSRNERPGEMSDYGRIVCFCFASEDTAGTC